MADINGSNYELEFGAEPRDAAAPGEYGGRVKCMYDSWTGAAPGDDIYFGKLPKGARILRLTESGGGTAPTFSVAVDDKTTQEEILILTTDGGDGAAAGYVYCEYLLD